MFSIKFQDPVIFSVIIFLEFLACASLRNCGKNMENFPGSPKYDAKHWATIGVFQSSFTFSKWNMKFPMMLKSGLEFL